MKKVLNDFCELIVDTKHKTPPFQEEGYPCIRTPNIGKGYFILENAKRVSERTYKEWIERVCPKENDLILAREAPVGNVAIIKYGIKVCHGQRTVLIRPNRNKINSNYLMYLLLGEELQNRMFSLSNGATVPHLNMSEIRNLALPKIPSNATQQKISSILSAYDDLIENNTRRIAILEEMAQMIYQEWFVKFRFPGHEKVKMVDSPLGKKPEGWKINNTESVIKRIPSGKKYDQKTVSQTGSIPVLDQGKSGIIGYHQDQAGVDASDDEPVIVFANHTCYQRIINFPFSAIQNVLPFIPNPNCSRNIYWLHWATKDLVQFNDYKGHWPEFMSKKLLLPPVEICDEFGRVVSVKVRLIHRYEKINKNLRQTRDLLLPKLISGDLDVSDLDIEIPDIAEPELQVSAGGIK